MISLIVTTRNRVAELQRLLESLERQTYRDFEVIVADQNSDGRLDAILQRHSRPRILHLHSECGASKGRNTGLRAAAGDLVAFPDDDCWYPDELLASIVQWFEQHSDSDGLITGLRDPDGKLMVPKFPPQRGPCSKRSVLGCATTNNIFLRANVVKSIGFFREDIGPGAASPYQSGEDLDYIIRPLEHGFRLWYEPGISVYHPDFAFRPRLLDKTYSYALGIGYVLRCHDYSWWVLGECLLRSLCGAGACLCRGDVAQARLYLLRGKGQFLGYFAKQNQLGDPAGGRSVGSDTPEAPLCGR